jgi:outer membrane protein TolC
VGQALETNPNTRLRQQQVGVAEGFALQAQGPFDVIIGTSAGRKRDLRPLRADEQILYQSLGFDAGRTQIQQSTNYSLGADKMLMNGIVAGAGFNVLSITDNLQQAAGVPSQLAGTLSFTLRVPMGRNAGRETVGAELDARQSELEAVRADLHHGNSLLVLDTALAYWYWVATTRRLEIAVASEQRLSELVEEMRRLINADQMPRADIELVLASRAEKSVQRFAAEQAVLESRKALARLLGIPAERLYEIGKPQDDFPSYLNADSYKYDAELVAEAMVSRVDLEATRYREQAARYRLQAARNNLKPQIDLNLGVGYTGLAEGTSAARFDRSMEMRAGPSAGATLLLQWPWENSDAKGVQRTASADYDAATIRLRDLQESVAINVPVALMTVRRAAKQCAEGAVAVTHYETTLKNEKTKRRLGNATVIDVINVEDRLNNSLQAEVALRQGYANAIAQLRFELGSLVRRIGEEYRVILAPLLNGRALLE